MWEAVQEKFAVEWGVGEDIIKTHSIHVGSYQRITF